MKKTYAGSCLCGEVKFEIEGSLEKFYLCHCKYCQKDTGSSNAANLFSSNCRITWLSGKDHITTFYLPKTRHAKSFCKNCGSAVPNQTAGGGLVVIPAGSLDTNIEITPTAHLFYSSKASWEVGLDSIKKFEKFPI